MKVLVIGGSRFIGRHLVAKLLEVGHQVTLLNRGLTNPQLFTNLERITFDRRGGQKSKLNISGSWDGAIDLSAYFPADVQNILSLLTGRIDRYILCSTTAVYPGIGDTSIKTLPTLHEDLPTVSCSKDQADDTSKATYGRRKAQCERVALNQKNIPVVIIRPGFVYGAFDPTDRFAYWIWRVMSNAPFVLPDEGSLIVRKTYAPDLAATFITALQRPNVLGKIYNVAETSLLSMRQTLQILGDHLKSKPLDRSTSANSDFLLANGIKPETDIAFWMPHTHFIPDVSKAVNDLEFVETPVEKAYSQAADYFISLNRKVDFGMSADIELKLLNMLT